MHLILPVTPGRRKKNRHHLVIFSSKCHCITFPEGCTSTDTTKELGYLQLRDPRKLSPGGASTCAHAPGSLLIFPARLPHVQARERSFDYFLTRLFHLFTSSIYLDPSTYYCILPPEPNFKKCTQLSGEVHCSGEKFSGFGLLHPLFPALWNQNLVTFIPMNWYLGAESPLIRRKCCLDQMLLVLRRYYQ